VERFQTAEVTFKVTQGHSYWRHSIGDKRRTEQNERKRRVFI